MDFQIFLLEKNNPTFWRHGKRWEVGIEAPIWLATAECHAEDRHPIIVVRFTFADMKRPDAEAALEHGYSPEDIWAAETPAQTRKYGTTYFIPMMLFKRQPKIIAGER